MKSIWINTNASFSDQQFTSSLLQLLSMHNQEHKPLAFACIGSSKIAGDNLGPLIGSILQKQQISAVLGTMAHPLNACNIQEFLPLIRQWEMDYYVIAIDAALGHNEQNGYITLSPESLKPGEAFSKKLPDIGHLSIKCIFSSIDTPIALPQIIRFCHCMIPGLTKSCTL